MNNATPQPSFSEVIRSVGGDKQVGVCVALLLALTIAAGILDLMNPISTNHELIAVMTMAAIVVSETTFSALTAITGRKVDGIRALTMLAIAVVLIVVVLLAGFPVLPVVMSLFMAAAISIPWVAAYTMSTFANKGAQKRPQGTVSAVVAPDREFGYSVAQALPQREKVAA